MSTSHYQLLGISPNATSEEIKKRYKKLAIKYHPDKTEDKAHHELFLRISEAYTTLIDSKLRSAYDAKAGFSSGPRYARPTQSSTATSSTSFRYQKDDYTNPFSYYRGTPTDTFRNGYRPSYFDFFRQSHRGTPESSDRGARHNTSFAKSAEDDSLLAAKLAQRKMKEAMERRRQEFVEQAQRQKRAEEERLRQEMHSSRMYGSRASSGAAYATTWASGGASDQYERAKFRAHHKAWAENSTTSHDMHAGDPEEPIVVEDEEEQDEEDEDEDEEYEEESEDQVEQPNENPEVSDDSVEEFHSTDAFGDQKTEPPLHDDNGETSFASGEFPTDSEAKRSPEVVEVSEEGGANQSFFSDPLNSPLRSPPASPRRMAREAAPHIKAQISKSINERMNRADKEHNDYQAVPSSHNSAKKGKFSNFEAMKASLGTDIDDVDFSDIRETLPKSGSRSPRRQPSSINVSERPSKKAKVSEFTNGSSKASTLFTPVNASYAKKIHNTISVSDLTPQTDDSKLIFNYTPPHIDLNENTSKEQWLAYVKLVNAYQSAFTGYREAVLNFQVDRLKSDVRHHNIIYSDSSCLGVYQSCLFNDVLLLQNFNRAMHDFRETIKEFNSNCVKVNSGDLNFQFSA